MPFSFLSPLTVLVVVVAAAVIAPARSEGRAERAAAAAAAPAALAPELHAADVRALLAWRFLALADRGLLDELRARVDACPELQLRGWILVWRSDGATADAVHAALDAVRHENAARALANAAASSRSLLRDYVGEDFAHVLVKATWIGEQTEPVPGLAVHSTSRVFEPHLFRAFRRRGIHFGNDDSPVFRTFAATSGEIAALVRSVLTADVAAAAMRRKDGNGWAITILDTGTSRRPNVVELLLDRDEARALFARMAEASPDHAIGRGVLEQMHQGT